VILAFEDRLEDNLALDGQREAVLSEDDLE
jgi:hypothetical protein